MDERDVIGWNDWFFSMARVVAQRSKDRSTQVGCIVVGPDREVRSMGYNGFPRGVDDTREDWHERPMKYLLTVHAEANAVANAARVGVQLKGCIAYVTLPPCSRCAALLINAGVTTVQFLDVESWEGQARWKEEFDLGLELFRQADVRVRCVSTDKIVDYYHAGSSIETRRTER